jgi:TetR/AcrR family transcriptional regulator, transcriptional repressor for nem operon
MILSNKRDRLIDSASELFHQKGLHLTSLADIASHADIPIGNVYYYFKTKEELALATVARRKEQFAAAYAALNETFDDPRERLIGALEYFDKVRDAYTKYGCPIGRIVEDADTAKDNVAKAAMEIFSDFVGWAEKQFEQLGQAEQARHYAISLMAGIQGGTVMAKGMNNAAIISYEIARLKDWVESLPNKKIHLGKAPVKLSEAANA